MVKALAGRPVWTGAGPPPQSEKPGEACQDRGKEGRGRNWVREGREEGDFGPGQGVGTAAEAVASSYPHLPCRKPYIGQFRSALAGPDWNRLIAAARA